MVKLAPQIRGNKELRQILYKIAPGERQALYETLKPHLSFKSLPFPLIMINL